MHYLYLLIEGTDGTPYDHIVVDEAQDVCELEFLIMRRFYTRRGAESLTILGDLPQSLYSHRGITSWDQVRRVFEDAGMHYGEMRRSYRTTNEIALCASDVIRALTQSTGKQLPAPEPFERHGPVPTLRALRSEAELIKTI